ncbi:MAG: hypothetical protein WCL43_04555 [Chlorobium sp.]|jgi:hypothetical protein
MAIESIEQKVASILSWVNQKLKLFFDKTLYHNIDNEMTSEPVKKETSASPKRNNEPVKWPPPVKK